MREFRIAWLWFLTGMIVSALLIALLPPSPCSCPFKTFPDMCEYQAELIRRGHNIVHDCRGGPKTDLAAVNEAISETYLKD